MVKKEKEPRAWNSNFPRRKTLLKRAAFERSKPINDEDRKLLAHAIKEPPKTHRERMRSMSKKQKRVLTKRYFPANSEFLKSPAARFCWICISRSTGLNRGEVQEIMGKEFNEAGRILLEIKAKCVPATEIHHAYGRNGRLLYWVPGFVASCRGCREWPHESPRQARELGLLASAADYNVFAKSVSSIESKMKNNC